MDKTTGQTALFFGFLVAGMTHVSAGTPAAADIAVSAPAQQSAARADAGSDLRMRRILRLALDTGATPRADLMAQGPNGEA